MTQLRPNSVTRRGFLHAFGHAGALMACTPGLLAASENRAEEPGVGEGQANRPASAVCDEALSISKRMSSLLGEDDGLGTFFRKSSYLRGIRKPGAIDLTFGNPYEMPLPEFVKALQDHAVPKGNDWYAYKRNEADARKVVADSLRARTGRDFAEDDIFMTNGATAALAMAIVTVTDPLDEVIYITPPWFGYRPLIVGAGAVPVPIHVQLKDLDLDLRAIASAITSRTRAVIINSPHNPTGKIYSRATLTKLADLLTRSSKSLGRPIFLLSDEAYRNVIYDRAEFVSPTDFYPHSFMVYTYGKVLLTPGQRLGWLALPPDMPCRALIRRAMISAQVLTGWCYPSALMQHAIRDLEKLSIDVARLQRKRDFMYDALTRFGYEIQKPQATFYLMARSPIADDFAFSERLAHHNVFVFPGEALGAPGFFRITLTATEPMLKRSIAAFEAAMRGT